MYYDFYEGYKVFYIEGYFNHEYYKIDYYYNKDLNDWKVYYEFVNINSILAECIKNSANNVTKSISHKKPSQITSEDVMPNFNIAGFSFYFYKD